MATEVSAQIQRIADQWEDDCGYPSAVLSGIRPDALHRSGYHPSLNALRTFGVAATDYSNMRPDDKGFNPAYGAAIDMSCSPADMKRTHDRVRKVWADTSDPRRKYINAINTWDGDGDAVRLDFYAGTAKYASPDHKWHNHLEIRRRYLLDWTAARAVVSVLRGDTRQQWLASIGQGDTDMTPEEHNWLETVHKALTVLDGRNPIGQIYTRSAFGEDHTQGTAYVSKHPTLKSLAGQLTAVQNALAALASKDFTDENAIVQGVLAGLDPATLAQQIADALPAHQAKQVADEIAARLVA